MTSQTASEAKATPPRRPGADAFTLLDSDAKPGIRILVVDDEHTIRESCVNVLQLEGYHVTASGSGTEALELLARRRFDIVLADLNMPQADGFAMLRTAVAANPDLLFIMITGNPSVQSSVEALREGAWDYLPKPFSATQLQVLVGRAAHTVVIGRESVKPGVPAAPIPPQQPANQPIGVAPGFRNIVELARRVATTDASVFIMGESGVGKEMIARYIHAQSRRSSKPFVVVNCAALPEAMLESEMFGHRKGAFTDAIRDKAGLLETANGGTVFLDELLDMSRPLQAKLLQVLQDGVVRRIGSEDAGAVVNVRFVAATNRNPESAIRDGSLREDLFYRLCVVPMHIPPLRDRVEDIPLLAQHCLSAFWGRHRTVKDLAPRFTEAAIRMLSEHPWQGNVRELQNVIEHAVVLLEPGADIQPTDLSLSGDVKRHTPAGALTFRPATVDEGYHAARDRIISDFELQYLAWLIERAEGNMSKAARIAGVDRTTLYRLMERHQIYRGPSANWLVGRPATPSEHVAIVADESPRSASGVL
jgi:DNA-binding NtrC family response regulator